MCTAATCLPRPASVEVSAGDSDGRSSKSMDGPPARVRSVTSRSLRLLAPQVGGIGTRWGSLLESSVGPHAGPKEHLHAGPSDPMNQAGPTASSARRALAADRRGGPMRVRKAAVLDLWTLTQWPRSRLEAVERRAPRERLSWPESSVCYEVTKTARKRRRVAHAQLRTRGRNPEPRRVEEEGPAPSL